MAKLKHLITSRGKTQSLVAWEKELDIEYHILLGRVNKGWSHNAIINTPYMGPTVRTRRCNIKLVIDGITLSIPEWSFATGLPDSTIRNRIYRGLKGLEIISPRKPSPLGRRSHSGVLLTYEYLGDKFTIKDLAQLTHRSYSTLYSRIRRGWSIEDVIKCPITPRFERAKGRVHVQ